MTQRFAQMLDAAWKAFRNANFISDRYVLSMIALGAAVNIFLWYYLKHSLGSPDSFKVTHYTFAMGADLLGKASDIYALAYQAAVLSLANVVLARLVYGYDALMAYMAVSFLPIVDLSILFQGILLVRANA